MLVRALLQTSLVLWLAQHTLQGGVKPHGVSWGKVLPARGLGLGVGVKPGVGALGALGSRHGSKAMKTGIGRYPGPQLGVGGYRSLGLGGRMKQGGYGAQGPYGASLGTGVPLGTGLTNGLGMGGGQAQKRAYGAGLGSLPGYGALPGNGYPGARPGARLWFPTGHRTEEQIPGVSAPELGGPELAGLGQAVPDPKREKSRVVVPPLYGKNYQTLGPEVPTGRGGGGGDLGPAAAAPELQAGGEAQNLGPSSLRPTIPLDKPIKNLGQPVLEGGENNEPVVLKRKTPPSRGAALAAGGVRQQLPPRRDDTRRPSSITDYGSPFHQNQPTPNCDREISRHELLGSETQRSPGLVPRPPLGKDGGHLGPERTNPLPLTHTQEVGGNVFSPPAGQGARNYVSAAEADRQGFTEPGPLTEVRGTGSHSPVEPQVPGRGRHGPVIPHTSVVLPSVEGQEAEGFTADSQDVKRLYHDVKEPKALGVPSQAGRNNQATRYIGGGGNYLGAGLGPGAYGAGLGQGAYLGGAAGKLGPAGALGQGGYPHGVAGKSTGYGDGATGYLGGTAGNGYGGDAGAKALSAGYGNGYGDGYRAGLGYPAELADGAENKAGKSQALTAGTYAGQVQGAYGALGAGLEPTGGKYGGGAAQGPYGNGPVIPAGLEGDGAYPYAPQQLGLGAEGVKTSNKYGYGAQLGATQDALGEQNGKYGGVNGALGYKG